MAVIERIAFYQNIRDEKPNQELARELAEERNLEGIAEIAGYLKDKNPNVRSDCLKVLYEIGYIAPDLITQYADKFLELLESKQNRLIWGSMIALSTIAGIVPQQVSRDVDKVIHATRYGTVITVVNGVKVLSTIAAIDKNLSEMIIQVLMELLETCIPRDVPTHAENMLPCINEENKQVILDLIKDRGPELSKAQMTRMKRVIRKIQDL